MDFARNCRLDSEVITDFFIYRIDTRNAAWWFVLPIFRFIPCPDFDVLEDALDDVSDTSGVRLQGNTLAVYSLCSSEYIVQVQEDQVLCCRPFGSRHEQSVWHPPDDGRPLSVACMSGSHVLVALSKKKLVLLSIDINVTDAVPGFLKKAEISLDSDVSCLAIEASLYAF